MAWRQVASRGRTVPRCTLPTWFAVHRGDGRSVALTVTSSAITVAAMFTGYYKFRERSHFLQ
ncbi:hypothetical protein ACLQ18_10840 [Streptomyces sp. DT193]|uniref:hypothetical protein n=1 Tax=Streptomyces sp. DT193 TaxID=3393418 RepID=UPI003CF81721